MNIKKAVLTRMCVYLLPLFFLFPVNRVNAGEYKTHCKGMEYNILSFEVESSKKIASICEGPNSSYLVYRFGKEEKIELQYPQRLDEKSWTYFKQQGWHWDDYIQEDKAAMYSLTFSNGNATYVISHLWGPELGEFPVEISVTTPSVTTKLKANKSSISGTLSRLDGNIKIKYAENPYLPP